jgi:hypothetical protein
VVWNGMFPTLIASWTYMDVICEIRLYTEASVCVALQDRLCFKAKKYIGLMKFINEIFLKTYHFPFISCTRVKMDKGAKDTLARSPGQNGGG